MSRPTHFILKSKFSNEKLYMYNAKTSEVLTLKGEHYCNMGQRFTNDLLDGKTGYGLEKIVQQLENK